jgi:hypothetical protein
MAAELRAENSLPSPMTAGLFVFLSRHSGMGPKDQTRNLEIPASMLRIAPE